MTRSGMGERYSGEVADLYRCMELPCLSSSMLSESQIKSYCRFQDDIIIIGRGRPWVSMFVAKLKTYSAPFLLKVESISNYGAEFLEVDVSNHGAEGQVNCTFGALSLQHIGPQQ